MNSSILSRVKTLIVSTLSLTPSLAAGQVCIVVEHLPPGTPPGDTLYVAGTFNGWQPAATPMTPDGQGRWRCCIDAPGRELAFKFTRGTWDRVEGDTVGMPRPNRIASPRPGDTLRCTIAGWEDQRTTPRVTTALPSVQVFDEALDLPSLQRQRRIWVCLPPGYAEDTARYPVLYMHDGQNLFDQALAFSGEWQVDESLDSLARGGGLRLIVVGIDNGGTHRMDEYSPWPNPRHGGGEGEVYLHDLVHTLKPAIDRHYRTLADPAHTGIMGSSMGGLISYYAGLRYPEVFGRVGVFSPSFWFSPQARQYAATRQAAAGSRWYFLAGGREGSNMEKYCRQVARQVGSAAPQAAVYYHADPEGRHEEAFWARYFPQACLWLFEE
ncbi:MAG: alpha/beta hydrolase-fold protein [Bacteroidia bacterium]